MKKFNFHAEIDLDDPKQVVATMTFLGALHGGPIPLSMLSVATPETSELKEEKSKRTRRSKAQIEADKKAKEEAEAAKKRANAKTQTKTEPELDEDLDTDLDGTEEVTLAEVRTALSEKVQDHRKLIVARLKALDATKISNLAEEHYGDFYEFLKGL